MRENLQVGQSLFSIKIDSDFTNGVLFELQEHTIKKVDDDIFFSVTISQEDGEDSNISFFEINAAYQDHFFDNPTLYFSNLQDLEEKLFEIKERILKENEIAISNLKSLMLFLDSTEILDVDLKKLLKKGNEDLKYASNFKQETNEYLLKIRLISTLSKKSYLSIDGILNVEVRETLLEELISNYSDEEERQNSNYAKILSDPSLSFSEGFSFDEKSDSIEDYIDYFEVVKNEKNTHFYNYQNNWFSKTLYVKLEEPIFTLNQLKEAIEYLRNDYLETDYGFIQERYQNILIVDNAIKGVNELGLLKQTFLT